MDILALETESTMQNTTTIPTKRIYWSAIFAGVIIALAMGTVLNLLGLGLGFTAFTVNAGVIATLGISTIIWLILSGIISMFAGGWVAGRMASFNNAPEGMLHGLLTWGLATLLSFILVASAGGMIISGIASTAEQGMSLLGSSVEVLGKGAMQVVPQLANAAKNIAPDLAPATDEITEQADQVLTQYPSITNNTTRSTEELEDRLAKTVTTFLSATTNNDQAYARQKLVIFLMQNTNLNQPQAEQMINNWQQSYNELKQQIIQKAEQAKQTAIAATEQATNIIGAIALMTFFELLLGAIAGGMGGMLGATKANKKLTAPTIA